MDEDYLLSRSKDKIRNTGKITGMQSVPVTQTMNQTADLHFGACVSTSNA